MNSNNIDGFRKMFQPIINQLGGSKFNASTGTIVIAIAICFVAEAIIYGFELLYTKGGSK